MEKDCVYTRAYHVSRPQSRAEGILDDEAKARPREAGNAALHAAGLGDSVL